MVVLLENNQFKKNLSPYDPMLNVSCPLWQQPFWNFHQNKKFKLCKEPFNDCSCTVWVQSNVEFTNQIKIICKMLRTTQVIFLPTLVPTGL